MSTRAQRKASVSLAQGGGGRAMRTLIAEVFAPGMGDASLDDGAVIPFGDRWLVFTTDAHVVQPAIFPGGDIGRLAACGTINDLAAMGATAPLGLSAAYVIEEGFPRADLERIQASLRAACEAAGTRVMTGDTKVMGRGEVDGIIITTTGIGLTDHVVRQGGLRVGDAIIVTGTMGDHGLAVMAARHGLGLGDTLRSDVAPLNTLVRAALDAGRLTALKDATRGGLASALNEMAEASGVDVVLEGAAIPVSAPAQAAAELLGIDPLHVANEGKVVMGVDPATTEAVLAALRAHPLGINAAVVGVCRPARDPARGLPPRVILDTGFGRRLVTEPEGEPLPRIC